MRLHRFYRHYGHSIMGMLLVIAIGLVAFDCGHHEEPPARELVRRAGW